MLIKHEIFLFCHHSSSWLDMSHYVMFWTDMRCAHLSFPEWRQHMICLLSRQFPRWLTLVALGPEHLAGPAWMSFS